MRFRSGVVTGNRTCSCRRFLPTLNCSGSAVPLKSTAKNKAATARSLRIFQLRCPDREANDVPTNGDSRHQKISPHINKVGRGTTFGLEQLLRAENRAPEFLQTCKSGSLCRGKKHPLNKDTSGTQIA